MKYLNMKIHTHRTDRLIRPALLLITTFSILFSTSATANDYLDQLTREASESVSNFSGFNAERGKTILLAQFGTGKPDTPACTSCHDKNSALSGKTRAGKLIEPMAVSVNPQRFTDSEKIEKWFGRNCRSVIGRECTLIEKGDFLTYMTSL